MNYNGDKTLYFSSQIIEIESKMMEIETEKRLWDGDKQYKGRMHQRRIPQVSFYSITTFIKVTVSTAALKIHILHRNFRLLPVSFWFLVELEYFVSMQ